MTEINYSPSLTLSMKLAKDMARQEKHNSYGVAHLVMAMLHETTGLKEVLLSMQKDVGYIMEWFDMHKEMYISEYNDSGDVCADEQVKKVMDEAERSKIKLGTDLIDAICVFTAIIREGVVFSHQQIETLDISEDDILSFYNAGLPQFSYQGEENQLLASVPYASNLKTEQTIQSGEIVVGREKEIRAILENLERSEHKGVMIVGGSGVGKTAILAAFVREICHNQDDMIRQITVIGLNAAKLLATTSSEMESAQRILSLLHKLNQLETQVVLVIDDLHILLDHGPSAGAGILINILNAQIGDGAVNLILTITNDSYRKHIEKHPIEGHLEVLHINEPERFILQSALKRHKDKIEAYYDLKIDETCINAAIHLSKRYFKERSLPSAAIDLLDRTTAAVRLSNKNAASEVQVFKVQLERLSADPAAISEAELYLLYNAIFNKMSVVLTNRLTNPDTWNPDDTMDVKLAKVTSIVADVEKLTIQPIERVTVSEIEAIVAESTSIPIGKIKASEKDRLLGIGSKLQERVKGQDRAIETLSDAIIESRSGMSDPKKPIGSFFFLGPTGTGKTELAKSLAELLFDDESAMIRFDMSEFKEEHSAALLYGAPPGYVGYEEGGLLVTQIRRKPYSVVLFDEIEKAHTSVYDVFLQMMDEGKIHDKLGREGDFSNSIIIFTSNIGSQWIADQIKLGKTPDSRVLIEVMSQHFRPEFLGRLTEIVPFSPINEQIAQEIFMLHFQRLQVQLLKQKNIRLSISESALVYLTAKGFSPQYGARPIAGVIRTYLKKTISRLIVSETINAGDSIVVQLKDGDLVWEQC